MKGLPNAFYVTPGLASITVTRKDLQELLLATDGWAIIRGRMMEIKSKHLGAGVYRVTVEDKREALRGGEVKNARNKIP